MAKPSSLKRLPLPPCFTMCGAVNPPRYNAVLSFDAETPEYALYLRAADLLVSYLHCRNLAAGGQGQYEEAEVQMLEAIHELALPEAEDYLARLYGANIHNETEEE